MLRVEGLGGGVSLGGGRPGIMHYLRKNHGVSHGDGLDFPVQCKLAVSDRRCGLLLRMTAVRRSQKKESLAPQRTTVPCNSDNYKSGGRFRLPLGHSTGSRRYLGISRYSDELSLKSATNLSSKLFQVSLSCAIQSSSVYTSARCGLLLQSSL